MVSVAIITGAASGIGAATTQELRQAGWMVIGVDLAFTDSNEANDGAGFDARLDVTSSDGWDALVSATVQRFGKIDLLVNCAAYLRDSSLIDLDPADLRRHFEVNVTGTFLGMQAAARAMIERRSGIIVNISSVSGSMAHAGRGAYAASKWATRGLSQTAALEWAAHGIRVCTVIPGPIDTPMSRAARGYDPSIPLGDLDLPQVPLRRFGQASEVAGLIAYLSSPAAAYITGSEFVIDGGFLLT